MRSHKTHIPLLREELIEEEILPRLPVKSLLRLRCVSKSWRSLIDSKRFIKTHLRNSTRNTSFPHHRLLVQNSKAKTMAQCSLLSLFNKPEIHALELNFPTNITIDSITCVGCCNGLVCILLNIKLDTAQFILWNPSTRISKKLPDMEKNMLGFTFRCFGFGSDESSDDYKVVAITRDGKQTMCSNIYSLKNDSWKKINDCKFFPIYPDLGILARGKLHWECRGETEESSWKIIAFDLKRDAFEVVEKPSDLERCPKPCLGMMGECLLVYCWHKPCIDIWVMKEYGVKESWEKVMVVDPSPTWASPSIAAFCIDAQGERLLMRLWHCMIYDRKNNWFNNLNASNESTPFKRTTNLMYDESEIYVESLVSPLDHERSQPDGWIPKSSKVLTSSKN